MNQQKIENCLFIIVFYGTACMGKTELVNTLKIWVSSTEVWVTDVNKDRVARHLMDAYQNFTPTFHLTKSL